MFSTTSVDSTVLCDIDRAEGGLFLCESDLIGALLLSHHATGSQPAGITPDMAGVLMPLAGKFAANAC